MEKFRIGILGTGGIAHKMATTLAGMEDAECCAVSSRSVEKAEAFAKEFGCKKVYGSYLDMARDSSIDLVYVATPNSTHFENSMLCLENGRNVLCEKPFTLNTGLAKKLFNTARHLWRRGTQGNWHMAHVSVRRPYHGNPEYETAESRRFSGRDSDNRRLSLN